MSPKHYFPETAANELVPRALKALVAANSTLSFLGAERVVFHNDHKKSQVTLISGGGSGHEPAWSGYVGEGLLSATANGDIFASPSMKQILTAIAVVPSDRGTILLITNYTGDKLHFGLAAERALANGLVKNIVVLPATDDVSIGRSKCEKVGRRGLAGNVITMKILGGAAAQGYSFERCVEIGKNVNSQLVSLGSTLDHCHVPGRQGHDTIPDDVCVIGAGIHNEPGAQQISPFPSVDELIKQMLQLLIDSADKERAFVDFKDRDEVVLLINNYGGLSNLELSAIAQETLTQLDKIWNIIPVKIYSGMFETSLNGPGFSITLWNLTGAARGCNSSISELTELLETDTSAPAWPNVKANLYTNGTKRAPATVDLKTKQELTSNEDLKVDPRVLERMLRRACDRAIASEPNLTEWDMVMGDGDCGETVKAVCVVILSKLDQGIANTGSILTVLYAIIDAVDDMGGTLGAIFGILLAAYATAIRRARTSTSSVDVYADCLSSAVESLKQHTGARVGDRTVMDVLIPFADVLASTRDFGKAVEEAERKAKGTENLKPGFGRASYVGIEKQQELPDPGAWALMEIVKGLFEGIEGK